MTWEQLSLLFTLFHCGTSRKDGAWGLLLSGTRCHQGIRWEHVPSPLCPLPIPLHFSLNQFWHNANSTVGGAHSFIHRRGSQAVISLCGSCIRYHATLVIYRYFGLAFNISLNIVCQVDCIWGSIRMTLRGFTTDRISAIKKQITWK